MSTLTRPSFAADREAVVPAEPTSTSVRVSIREVREYALRAMVAQGASAGEAAHLAAVVVHAELHAGVGLRELAATLDTGPWSTDRLSLDRGYGAVLRVRSRGRRGSLQLGTSLVDVATAQPGSLVVSDAELPADAMLDAPLLSGAAASGLTLLAMQPDELLGHAPADVVDGSGSCLVRLATPAGAVGVGVILASCLPAEWLQPSGGTRSQTTVATLPAVTGETTAAVSWVSAMQRADRRHHAARWGMYVDQRVWQRVSRFAARFLVPEAGA